MRSTVVIEDEFTFGGRATWTGTEYAVAYSALTNNFTTRSFVVTRLTRTSLPRTRSAPLVVEGAPVVGVNQVGDLMILVSESRAEGTLPPTPRIVAYDEDELGMAGWRRRIVGR